MIVGLIFFIVLSLQSKDVKKGKHVTTMIDTKWSLVPLVLEMAEFMAEESQHSLWSFVDAITDLNPALNELGMG